MPQTPRTELASDPLAPLTSHSRAWIALAEAARTISDFSRSLLPGAAHCTLGGVVTGDAVRLAALAQRLIAAAIVLERTSGASWDELADPLGITAAEAREQWEPTVAQWETDLEAERAASLARTSLLPVDSPATAVELDDWVRRHREPADLDDHPHPVSGQLQRMDPLRELLHLAGTRRALIAAHDDSPPEVLLTRLADRERTLIAAASQP
ncbi:MAG: hypothetical protein JWP64_2859 [Pseudonocardia sp.]|jgi:hypothetical protein|uniref:hypothetical protein n=1 Tax=Pseudonocardia sp. TaxID=60912 RepID=UPI00260F2C17|nr:hypothetical protein [Pseudonocardia sp.]MCU1627910.1 hypothetical protein [Pseudonocardia sp.]